MVIFILCENFPRLGPILFCYSIGEYANHRLSMQLDLQSLFGLHVHSCIHCLRPRNPLPPAFGLKYEGAIGQPR
jgi:hypothetical protein